MKKILIALFFTFFTFFSFAETKDANYYFKSAFTNHTGEATGSRTEDYEGEIADLTSAIELKPDFAEAYYYRAGAEFGQDGDNFLQDWDKAIELKPDYMEAYRARGYAMYSLGRYEEAVMDFNKALKFRNDDGYVYYHLGLAEKEMGNDQAALDNLMKLKLYKCSNCPSNAGNREIEEINAHGITLAARAGETSRLVNFGNYNTISKATVNGDFISFEAFNGTVNFNPDSLMWSYDWKSNTGSCICRAGGTHYMEQLWPGWLKKSTYPYIMCADDEKKPGYMVVAQVNEGGISEGCEFVDIAHKRVYELVTSQYSCVTVTGNTAWIGSCIGIFKLEIDTGKVWKYATLPACTEPVGVGQYGGTVYFADKNYGIFAVNQATGEMKTVYPVYDFDDAMWTRFTYLGLAGDELYTLSARFSRAGWSLERNSLNLCIYSLKTGKMKTVPVDVPYADYMTVSGDNLLFYGQVGQDEEGEEPAYEGGIFAYNTRSAKVTVITKIAVQALWPAWNGFKTLNYSYEPDGMRFVEGFLDSRSLGYKPVKVTYINNNGKPAKPAEPGQRKQKRLSEVSAMFGSAVTRDIGYMEMPFDENARGGVMKYYYRYEDPNYKKIPEYYTILTALKVKVQTMAVSLKKADAKVY